MIEKQNKIIIIDNEPTELTRLSNVFLNIGVGCRSILYDIEYEDEPFTNVRLAFFDINLTLGKEVLSGEDIDEILERNSPVFNDLANAINQYISIENGPYALIFWTKNVVLIDAFIQYVTVRNLEIAKPIFIGNIDKTSISQKNPEHLIEHVLELINSNETIKFLFDIEENCRKSAAKAINKLFSIVPKDLTFGENTIFTAHLDLVLSKIAASTLGYEHAKENKQKAIYEGLLPLINYNFINSEEGLNWDEIAKKLNETNKIVINDQITNQLNSLYHLEEYISQAKDFRGALIKIDKENVAHLKTLNIDEFDEWCSRFLAIKDTKKATVLSNSELIAIEISAACDFSNKKSRINKYILGVATKNLNQDPGKDLNLKIRPETCYHLGGCAFYHDDNNYNLFLNLNYVFSSHKEAEILGDIKFLLKKEIMDMLGNKYASHVSRIGITTI